MSEEGGQYWAFIIELGNDSLVSRSPMSSTPQSTRPNRRATSDTGEEAPWFKFSVLECCMKSTSISGEVKNCNTDQQPAREGSSLKQLACNGGLLQKYLSTDGIHSNMTTSRGQLQTKKAKFIKRKSS